MKKNNTVYLIISALAMIAISIFLIYLSNKSDNALLDNSKHSNSPISKEGFFFDTYIRISLYDCKENDDACPNGISDYDGLLKECLEICHKYELILSPTNPDSELFKLNNEQIPLRPSMSGSIYTLQEDLQDIIDKSNSIAAPFGERFSVHSGDLCALWDFKQKKVPTQAEINKELSRLKETPDFTSITLGATAKGYITDKIADYLKSEGIKEALIDLGGNIMAIGNKYDNTGYKIGIKKPFTETGEAIAICNISDKTVVTSGIYERYFEDNGTIYHHIIDTTTGYPSDNGLLAVTIIADSSLVADCYSTGCMLYDKEYILNLINSKKYEDVECIIIDEDYNITLSDGLKYDENRHIVLK